MQYKAIVIGTDSLFVLLSNCRIAGLTKLSGSPASSEYISCASNWPDHQHDRRTPAPDCRGNLVGAPSSQLSKNKRRVQYLRQGSNIFSIKNCGLSAFESCLLFLDSFRLLILPILVLLFPFAFLLFLMFALILLAALVSHCALPFLSSVIFSPQRTPRVDLKRRFLVSSADCSIILILLQQYRLLS